MATETHSTEQPHLAEGLVGNLARMEGQIDQVLSWAEVLAHIGTCPNTIQPGAIQVIANALDDLAGHLRDRHEAAWLLATGQEHLA
jgi:hypothetical protein